VISTPNEKAADDAAVLAPGKSGDQPAPPALTHVYTGARCIFD
jgi:hypothetical protein